MEGKERKEQWRGEEKKRKMPRFSSLLPSWRTSGTCMCTYVYLYLKSRNHDLLKELKELDGIIEQRRRAVSDDLGSKVAS